MSHESWEPCDDHATEIVGLHAEVERLTNEKDHYETAGHSGVVLRERDEALAQVAVLLNPLKLARLFHETYERLAPLYGYETRLASAVPDCRCPDGLRYRALGNAVTVSVVHWIAERLKTVMGT